MSSTSSTRPSEPRGVRLALAAVATAAIVWVSVTGALEVTARWIEVREGGYLWWQEEWLQLMTPSNYVDRGPGRLLVMGSSEAREGFLDDELAAAFPGVDVYQGAVSNGSIEDARILLEYIEREHGPAAIPERIVLGINPRWVIDHHVAASTPLLDGIDRYAPHLAIDRSRLPIRLVPKGRLDGLLSRWRFLSHQTQRYRRIWRGLRRSLLAAVRPAGEPEPEGLRFKLTPSKYHHLRPRPKEPYFKLAPVAGTAVLKRLRDWEPRQESATIAADFDAILSIGRRHGTRFYLVNMPEGSWARLLYDERRYTDYLAAVSDATAGIPLVDLRDFLADDDFHDWSHPTREGARKLSHRVALFIREADALRPRGEGR